MSSQVYLKRPAQASSAAFVVSRKGSLDLRGASELRTELLDALTAHPSVAFDASDVTSVDAGAIQVLLAARRSAEQAGRDFSIIAEAGGALPDTLARLGLTPLHA